MFLSGCVPHMVKLQEFAKNSLLPGLELFGTEWVCDILNRVTQAVGVVIGGVDTPIEKDEKRMTHWKTWKHVKW